MVPAVRAILRRRIRSIRRAFRARLSHFIYDSSRMRHPIDVDFLLFDSIMVALYHGRKWMRWPSDKGVQSRIGEHAARPLQQSRRLRGCGLGIVETVTVDGP